MLSVVFPVERVFPSQEFILTLCLFVSLSLSVGFIRF